MNRQRDLIESYIPSNPKFVILGTMCALNAREINGVLPEGDFFYYNDNRNHFWKILQYILESQNEPIRMTVKDKKAFLKRHRIGIQNLVHEIETSTNDKLDPSDTVLFDCQKRGQIKFKELDDLSKKRLRKTHLFFTCRHKKGIQLLLEGFCAQNNLGQDLIERTHFLKTPTRCNPYKRSQEWLEEMSEFIELN